MLLLIQQRLTVVLPVDIQQPSAQCLQLAHRDRPPVDAADVLSVAVYLPLEQQRAIRFRCDTQLLCQGAVYAGKRCAHKRLVRAGADQLPAGALAQHGAECVDDDGLTRARLAGQRIEPPLERDVRLLNDGNILDVQQLQHAKPSSVQHLPHLLTKIRRVTAVVEHQ